MTIYEDELEPDNEKPVTVQTATSEAHELLKKEIAAATADEPETQQAGAGERSGDFSYRKYCDTSKGSTGRRKTGAGSTCG